MFSPPSGDRFLNSKGNLESLPQTGGPPSFGPR
jgi:hypothetical protein